MLPGANWPAMEQVGRFLALTGAALVVVGGILWALGRAGLRGLPGDLRYEGEHVRVYFPIMSSIALSVILTAGLWLWQWLSRK